ncbi:MAG: hypothetical protein ACXW1M_03900 [Acidimicrobiia bacterium]
MSTQLRLLPNQASTRSAAESTTNSERAAVARPRRRRRQGPAGTASRIDTRTRRAGRQGVAQAREALLAATTEAELRRAG